MARKKFSRDERRKYAKQASARGDADVARRVGRKKETVAAWRREFSFPVARFNHSQQTNEVLSSPLSLAHQSADDLTLVAEPGLLPPVLSLSLEERRALADRSEFPMSTTELKRWKKLSEQPARELPELQDFMAWRSPYINYDDPKLHPTES